MRGFFAGLVVLAACGPPTVRVAGVTLQLHTPADVDPLAGADTLFVRVQVSEIMNERMSE